MTRARRLIALVLLAVLGALGTSVADAASGHRRSTHPRSPAVNARKRTGSRAAAGLDKRFPLGTQTLCCRTSASTTSSPAAAAAAPATPAAKASSHGGSILAILAGVAGFLLGGLVVAEALALRRRRARRTPTSGPGDARVRRRRARRTPTSGPGDAPAPLTLGTAAPAAAPAPEAVAPERLRPAPGPTGVGGAEALELAIELHRSGDRAAAAAAYRRAEIAGQPMAAFNLGVLLYESADLDGAEQAWRRCLDDPESRAVAATNLGFLLDKRGDLRGARNAYLAAARWGDPTAQARAERLAVGARQ